MQADKPTDQATSPSAAPQNAGRRAWLRKGALAASPVLVSLASAPVHAAGVCVLPSGFISVATFNSRHPGAMTCVGSFGPNYWLGSFPGTWPTSPAPNTQTEIFTNVFFGTTYETGMAGKTMKQVLEDGSFTDFTKYCIAGYLNARVGTSGFPTALNDVQMVAVWSHFHGGTSTLIPPSWTKADALAWLQRLMDA